MWSIYELDYAEWTQTFSQETATTKKKKMKENIENNVKPEKKSPINT